MTFEDYRTLFLASCLALILLSAGGLLGPFLPLPRSQERFSELWALGPGRMAEGYPFSLRVAEPQRVYVGVRNHLGAVAYYALQVKLRAQAEPLPNQTTAEPSPLQPLYEFRFFLADNGTWETPLDFALLDAGFSGGSCLVKGLALNGEALAVGSLSHWDDERKGFFFELFFELWLYNATSAGFEYHNRFVGLWLNVTA